MDPLKKTFVKGNVLTAQEMNELVAKINELVDARLQIGTDPGTAYDGASGAALEQLVGELAGAGGAMYSVYLRNNLPSLAFATQLGEKCVLDFTFVSQYRDQLTDPYKPTGELGLLTVMVKNTKFTEFTVVRQMEIASGTSVKLDVSEYLTSGQNSVKMSVKGENTEREASPVTWTLTLTSLGVSAPNFQWWTAFAGDIQVPMLISGNIAKTLHVEISGEEGGYAQSYTKPLGTAIYTDTPYIYAIPHPGATGIYRLRFWLSNSDNTIQTRAVEVSVMCIASAGESVTLMVVNNVAEGLVNWQSNTVFEYAIYDGAATAATATFYVDKDDVQIFSSENNDITTGTRHVLNIPLEVETDDDADFTVTVSAVSMGAGLITPVSLPVNNSLGYSATAGAALYINPRTRANTQTNARSVVNEVDQSAIPVEWTNMNWNNDGWVADGDGTRCLKIFARSRAVIDFRPFLTERARTGLTVELDYKVENPSDASQTVIDISEASGGSFTGLRISSENISLFSQSRRDSSTQDLPKDDNVRLRVTAVIMPDAYGNAGFNLVCLYVNGRKNRQFDYQSNDYFRNAGRITLGNDDATLYLYGLRVYYAALTEEAVRKNFINQLATAEEKQAEAEANDLLDAEGVGVDFEKTKRKKNVFVFDTPFPNLNNPGSVTATLQVCFADHPERDFTVTYVLLDGQGTSSKKYLEWNMRARLGKAKDAAGATLASVVTYADGTTETNRVRMFDGVPKCKRITFKKNWASSMQDHKAGSVNLYDDLYKAMGMRNEGMAADASARVAVYQEPFVGFSKSVNEEGKEVYTCMGEFTGGPDKGDDACFGYDTGRFPDLISVEGSDNAPLGALFRVPWNPEKGYWRYNADEEAFQYNGANCWDFDAGELDGAGEPRSAALWREAYNLVYACSDRLLPFEGTLEGLNAAAMELRGTGYEYWVAQAGGGAQAYDLFYYEPSEGRFVASDTGGGTVNLATQLAAYLPQGALEAATTSGGRNELFRQARRAKFRAEAPALWDIDDAVFHHNFTELHGGTDQRAKNTYPYRFTPDGGKWKWRLDDADTILPIDNQGQDRKPYWCEMHDFYDNGQPVWNGETSVFWNLLEAAFADELAAGMRKMLAAMEKLGGMAAGTPYDKVYACYRKYFLGVKEYFPAVLVNADAKRYEVAKIAYDNGSYTNDTDPITQSHGDFYSAETAWMKKRIMYIMSKYSYGLFSADGTDSIIVRAAGDLIDYDITPAYNMYPAIANGTSIIRGPRTAAGDTCRMTVDLGGSADQQNAIQGASWLLDIGDWHGKNVSGTMIVRGRRLRRLLLGSRTEDCTISITGLTLADCGSMQTVLVSNIATLQGTLDLSALLNLREVYAGGTSLSQIKLPDGGGLEVIEFPANNKYITFRNFPMLTTAGLVVGECAPNIIDFLIEQCPQLNPIDTLSDIIAAQLQQGDAHNLQHIRATGFDVTYDTPDVLDLLSRLADGTYSGLDASGLAGTEELPVLEGRITVNSKFYQDAVDALRRTFDRLELIMLGEAVRRWIDPVLFALLRPVWDTDGDGYLTDAEMATQQGIPNGTFSTSSKAGIKSLLDLKKLNLGSMYGQDFTNMPELVDGYLPLFSNNTEGYSVGMGNNPKMETVEIGPGVTVLNTSQFANCPALRKVTFNGRETSIRGNQAFMNCTALEEITLPAGLTEIPYATFLGCTSLRKVNLSHLTYVGGRAFMNCPLSDMYISMPELETLDGQAFNGGAFVGVRNLGKVTTFGECFQSNSSLRYVELPATLESLTGNPFFRSENIEQVVCYAVTPPAISYAFPSKALVYVPDNSREVYRAAPVWSSMANRIYPLSDLDNMD